MKKSLLLSALLITIVCPTVRAMQENNPEIPNLTRAIRNGNISEIIRIMDSGAIQPTDECITGFKSRLIVEEFDGVEYIHNPKTYSTPIEFAQTCAPKEQREHIITTLQGYL